MGQQRRNIGIEKSHKNPGYVKQISEIENKLHGFKNKMNTEENLSKVESSLI